MFKHCIITLFILSLFSCSQGSNPIDPNPQPQTPKDTLNGWQKYFLGVKSYIGDIVFVNPAKGFALVAQHGIFRSLDSGKTWQLMDLPHEAKDMVTINFMNSTHGYCTGAQHRYGYTTDGGDTWVFKLSPESQGMDIWFPTTTTGYLAGNQGLFKTSNGGTSWNSIRSGHYTGVQFFDNNKGWAIKSNYPYEIIYTNDGGNSWVIKNSPASAPLSLHFFTESMGMVKTELSVLTTINGGATWASTPMAGIFDVQIINHNLAYATANNKIMKSVDGGATWTKDAITTSTLVELFFLDKDHGWAAGDSGVILRWKN